MTTRPALTVVIPTYNRLRRWPLVLDSLARQTYGSRRFEVVVVSDGSTDGTDDFLQNVRTPFDLVFASQPNAGPAAARNRGMQLASSALILFLDDDIIAAPDLIEEHVHAHELNDDKVVVIGPMATPRDFEMSAPIRWEQAMLYKQYGAMLRGDYPPTYRQVFTGNASMSREGILGIGGFDVRFRRAEDVELAYRLHEAGFRFLFNSDAIGYHYAERSFGSWLRNAHDYGVNDVMFSHEHPTARLLERTREEFRGRHVLVRWTTKACVARPQLEPTAQRLLRGVAEVSDRLHARALTQGALSGAYNISYYCGMADELGGSKQFRELVIRSRDCTDGFNASEAYSR